MNEDDAGCLDDGGLRRFRCRPRRRVVRSVRRVIRKVWRVCLTTPATMPPALPAVPPGPANLPLRSGDRGSRSDAIAGCADGLSTRAGGIAAPIQ
jgi:hypothetical protein